MRVLIVIEENLMASLFSWLLFTFVYTIQCKCLSVFQIQ